MQIDVLNVDDSTKYLGRKLNFSDPHRTEVESRIASAWKKFFVQKQELTSKTYSLNDRLRLFHGTVTPTVLYGCEAWTMTVELENRLQRTQRQMLRMIIQSPRRRIIAQSDTDSSDTTNQTSDEIPPTDEVTLEPWQEWISRCTHEAESRMKKLKLEDWKTIQRRRKWKWAHKVAMSTQDSWILRALNWDPSPHLGLLQNRRVGRPKKRWADDIKEYVDRTMYNATPLPSINPRLDNMYWLGHARSAVTWMQLGDGYI